MLFAIEERIFAVLNKGAGLIITFRCASRHTRFRQKMLSALLFSFNGDAALALSGGASAGQGHFDDLLPAILALFGLLRFGLSNSWNVNSKRSLSAWKTSKLPKGEGQPPRQTLSRPLAASS